MGIGLSRATMANWIIYCSDDFLKPVIDHLHRKLLEWDVVYGDETPIQVLKKEGKKPQTKSYMWLYCTGNDGKEPIVFYNYQPSRNGDNAVNFLKDFKGYVHSDGYSGYNKLSCITGCGCWAHLRRNFVEAIPVKKDVGVKPTNSEIGRDYCNQLFKIEEGLKDYFQKNDSVSVLNWKNQFLRLFRLGLISGPTGRGLFLESSHLCTEPKALYGELPSLWKRLHFKHAAENAIRPFTVGGKNWLFADTLKGTNASAIVYSIIETAKMNGLNVYTYLEYLLLYMPDTNWQDDPKLRDDLMPWSADVQDKCKK